jgi:hypothetical protein
VAATRAEHGPGPVVATIMMGCKAWRQHRDTRCCTRIEEDLLWEAEPCLWRIFNNKHHPSQLASVFREAIGRRLKSPVVAHIPQTLAVYASRMRVWIVFLTPRQLTTFWFPQACRIDTFGHGFYFGTRRHLASSLWHLLNFRFAFATSADGPMRCPNVEV